MGRFLTADTHEGNDEDTTSFHRYLFASGDPVDMADPTGNDSVFSSALRSVFLRSARLGASVAARYAVRLVGCAAAAAVMLICTQAIIENGLPFIKLPHGAGINVAVGFGAEEVGQEVVDGKLPWVIGIYAKEIVPQIALTVEQLTDAGYTVVVSTTEHAEILVKNTIQAAGRVVGGIITLWRLCPSCAQVFQYTGEALGRGLGNCVELIP